MKRFLLLAGLLLNTLGATTRYIAQSAGTFSGGSSCNGQTAITPATWNSTSESAGDISYVCGTLTGSVNTTILTFGWGGSSGNPIQLVFDTNGIVQSNACNINGCIYSDGNNYITVNGGTNGLVQNTLNGTSGAACPGGSCSVQQDSQGVNLVSCTGCTIKNLTISDIYLRNSTSDTNQYGQGAVIKNNSVSGATNSTFQNNVVHDASNCIFYFYGTSDSGLNINGNEAYNCNWLIAAGAASGTNNLSGGVIYGNKLHDTVAWDDYPTPYNNHHNYVALFNGNSPSTLTGMVVYNNENYGNFGNGTAVHYLDNNSNGNSSATYFNEYTHLSGGGANGGNGGFLCQSESGTGSVTCHLYNNTDVGLGNVEGFWMQGPNVNSNIDIRDNIISSWDVLFYSATGTGFPATMDHNDWYNASSAGWQNGSTQYTTISAWRTASSLDTNSITSNPLLNSNGTLQSGSPAIGLGTNLNSTCTGQPNPGLGALCFDKSGSARPTSAAWDAGAYQYATTGGSSISGGISLSGGARIQ